MTTELLSSPPDKLSRYLAANYPDAKGDTAEDKAIDALESMDIKLGMKDYAAMQKGKSLAAQATQQWKCGNEFLPYHPQASHINPDHRDGWNACWAAMKVNDLAGSMPDGWVSVPKAPTLEMVIAGENMIGRHAYAAMLSAAPKEQT